MKKEKWTTNTAEIQRIIRDYYKQLYNNKIDDLEEMDKFLERYNFSRLDWEELENINRPITRKEIETVIKNLLTNKRPRPDGFTGKFCQTFREEITPVFQTFPKNCRGRSTPKLILQGHHHPDTKTRQINYQKKLQNNTTGEQRHKILKKSSKTECSNTLKDSYTVIEWDLSQGCKDSSIYSNQCDTLY